MYNDILVSIVGTIIGTIILGVLSIVFFINPFKQHKKIYSKIRHLQRNYRDVFNENSYDSFIVGIMEKQCKEINSIIDNFYELIDSHPIFSYLFNYKKVLSLLSVLFYYTKDPIMLPKDKLFEKNYEIDLKKLFNKIYLYMNIQYKVLILLVIIFILFFTIKSLVF